MQTTRHLIISGRVQGVSFRYHTSRVAHELGISGWVRNRSDGSVEAMVSGSHEAVEKMIEWARHGPRRAIVTGITVEDGNGDFSSFDTLPTQ